MKLPHALRTGAFGVGCLMVVGVLGVGGGTSVSWAKQAMLEPLVINKSAVHLTSGGNPQEAGALLHLVGRLPSKGEIISQCMKERKCREMYQAKKKRRPAKGRPAATRPIPEEIEELKGRKPDRPSPGGSRSELIPFSASSLLAWLNPFNVGVAEAALLGDAEVDLARPGARDGTGLITAYLSTYGGAQYSTQEPRISHEWPSPWPGTAVPTGNTEGKSYLILKATLLQAGFYITTVFASPGQMKMRHSHGGPIVDNWDYTNTPCDPCNYTHADWYEAGTHYWYIWSPDGPKGKAGYMYIDGARVAKD